MQAKVMGVLNCTPDSFYEHSRIQAPNQILESVAAMIAQGVDILDVGAQSSAPNAAHITVEEEIQRLIPVIKLIKNNFNIPISVDTKNAATMRRVLELGVEWINDITALCDPDSVSLIKDFGVKVVLMHMKGTPKTMQEAPKYENVVSEVYDFLVHRIAVCEQAGISKNQIIIDPGFGFGKTPEQNIALIKNLSVFKKLACPVLVGFSRKATIGYLTNKAPNDRLAGSLAAHQIAVQNGADIIRTHDVGPTKDMLKIYYAMGEACV